MLVIDENKYIHINRGDRGTIHFSIDTDDGEKYIFQPNDKVIFSVKEKYSDAEPLIRKIINIEQSSEDIDSVDIILTKNDTTIGELINKPKKYVYDIALNEDDTVVGYKYEEGPRYFILYPEGSNDE